MFDIEVVYAVSSQQQHKIALQVKPGTTIAEAIEQSNLLSLCPEINLSHYKIGIFSKMKALSEAVQHGDRVEIYRPLLADPKQARLKRVRKL